MSSRAFKFCWECYLAVVIFLVVLNYLALVGYLRLPLYEKVINKCGGNYFLSTILVSDAKYKFEDVVGCNKNYNFNCTYSIIDSKINNFYNNIGDVDENTLAWLGSLDTDKVYYVSDLSKISNKRTVALILNSTINDINRVWFKLSKFNTVSHKKTISNVRIKIITSINDDTKCEYIMSDILTKL